LEGFWAFVGWKSDPKIEFAPSEPSSFLGAEGRWVTLALLDLPPPIMFFKPDHHPPEELSALESA
jgi:hypothetical protein